MSTLQLVAHQARYDLRAFLRDPRARGFTFAFPVVMLIIFLYLFHGNNISDGGQKLSAAGYYVPRLAAMTIVGATLASLTITIVSKRQSGALKRRRATPVPAWVLVVGDACTSVLSAIAVVALLIIIGAAFYGFRTDAAGIGMAVVACIVGGAAFCCMAYALSTFTGSADSVGPAIQLATLPVYVVSGIYIPDSVLPHWLNTVGEVLPVRPLAVALESALVPATNHGSRVDAGALLIVAVWGVAGLLIAVRRFSWVPRRT
jgi:ABC-2 type transport system permease protein